MTALLAGKWLIEVDAALLQLAAPRCQLQAFHSESARFDVHVRLVQSFENGWSPRPLEGVSAPWGEYAIRGDEVQGRIPDDAFAAEAVLRAAYQLSVVRQGGLLVHASGFRFGDRAFVATGVSGAGKSTLARLCSSNGATLLSDEIVALYPDGSCHGTPFRSDPDLAGSPGFARLASLLLLAKGSEERLEPVPASEAMSVLLSQTFRAKHDELTPAIVLARLADSARVGVRRLTFRKDVAVAAFLRSWLDENGSP